VANAAANYALKCTPNEPTHNKTVEETTMKFQVLLKKIGIAPACNFHQSEIRRKKC
jgi:hypothetical protein